MTCSSKAKGYKPAEHRSLFNYGSINVGEFERMASIGGGLTLALMGAGRIPWRAALALAAGGALVYRGLSGHCHLYNYLGMDTAHAASPARGVPAGAGVRVEETILVDASPEDLYAAWRNLENLPKFMQHLENVEVVDDRHSKWTAKAPLGTHVSWDAEIITDKPNELLAWRSIPGSMVDTAGSVRFERAAIGAPTSVHVELKYSPIGGRLAATLANLFGAGTSMIRKDLEAWKHAIEHNGHESQEPKASATNTPR